MKICHLCLNGPYNEGWNYQENILPKYHVKQGHRVYQIVTPYMWKENELAVSHDKRYVNEDGVEVIRCKAKKGLIGGIRFNRYPEVFGLLDEIHPDILFIHDVQCLDIMVVVKYLKKHGNVLFMWITTVTFLTVLEIGFRKMSYIKLYGGQWQKK